MKKGSEKQSRRNFFLKSVPAAIGAIGGVGLLAQTCNQTNESEETVSLLSTDGELVKINKSAMAPVSLYVCHLSNH